MDHVKDILDTNGKITKDEFEKFVSEVKATKNYLVRHIDIILLSIQT